jgi:hypothetical protein
MPSRLGNPIAELGLSYPPEMSPPSTGDAMVSNYGPSFAAGIVDMGLYNVGSLASTAWFAANCPAAYPFVVNEPKVIYQLGWMNGSAAGGNWDVGVYDTSWNRLISAGSTGGASNSTYQFVNVTDTPIKPGRYYLVGVHDVTTANHVNASVAQGLSIQNMTGAQDSATAALPLPDPLTNMVATATNTVVPILLISWRAQI